MKRIKNYILFIPFLFFMPTENMVRADIKSDKKEIESLLYFNIYNWGLSDIEISINMCVIKIHKQIKRKCRVGVETYSTTNIFNLTEFKSIKVSSDAIFSAFTFDYKDSVSDIIANLQYGRRSFEYQSDYLSKNNVFSSEIITNCNGDRSHVIDMYGKMIFLKKKNQDFLYRKIYNYKNKYCSN